ncbi:MAG: alkaline phosphatase D family protein [Pseudomonadota bacterium]
MANSITRRSALAAGLAAGAASCSSPPKMTAYSASDAAPGGAFAYGVASGDPDATSVVIWSHLTHPDENATAAQVQWECADDPDFTQIRASGDITTGRAWDWTVKTLVNDLAPGGVYYYRFRFGDALSPVGRTRTLPDGEIDAARFAIVSCSNYPFGFFNVYDLISRRDDLDAVIHLGDYIYEYGPEDYGGSMGAKLGRNHNPPYEIITLSDYRKRHAQYKSDPSSQAMLARHPLIAIWDDHETTNNSWKDGAENHQPETEGDWTARRRAALQAYYEWMPIREPERGPEHLFKTYNYGNLLSLSAIETRLMARTKQLEFDEVVASISGPEDVARFKEEVLWDESRELLGAAQIEYLDRAFRSSVAAGHPWRLIANQVIMASMTMPDLNPHITEEELVALEADWPPARAFVEASALPLPASFDAWDGYPAARERFYDMVKETRADGMIVVTGDTHTWWANDLADAAGTPMGVELGTHSVTSPSPYAPSFLGGKGNDYALLNNQENEAVRFLSGEFHGYISLTITQEKARAEFTAVDNIESRDYKAFVHAAFDIKRKNGVSRFSNADGLSFREGWLF